MEAYEEGRESSMHKTRDSEECHGDLMQGKMEKLTKMKEELQKAKDEAMQSWLDSRPLIDELEKLQSGLASARNRASMSNVVISELESQLEATKTDIQSKMEEEIKVAKMTNEITQALDHLREELERTKLETDEERRERSKLKQVLRLRRQTLRKLQLTLRAVQIESEAFGESAAAALGNVKSWESQNNTVQLSQEEYLSLKRRAKERTSLSDWRISVSTEQKLAAEASRNLASKRWKEILSEKNMSWRRRTEYGKTREDGYTIKEEEEEEDSRSKKVKRSGNAFPRARPKPISKSNSRTPPQKMRGSARKRNEKLQKKKKQSILQQIRSFVVQSMRKLFG
ncbi:hypothetical protein SADUNF_Sadunf05G0100400 [Salix dunnii]|uniref:Uncharacterized protein n=1 Tax=Salix dunnii TaxID=1413687 RepID=A0A835MYY8_9ROSI|nr:hypothetical protein SADUNF_Sadunf05G0100400 [Salix dunnii]